MNNSNTHKIEPPCTLHITDEQAMMELGGQIACLLARGGVVLLHGNLGAGKTTLVRGLLRSLGFEGTVKSPTYTLVEPYHVAGRDIYHFDLYRLADPEELEYLGVRDYFRDDTLCLIEWPQQADGFLPKADLEVTLLHDGSARIAQLKTPHNH
ncbi:tRNA (adenosine(37)-N6)-threonylcarbamoyltransferase complex ATPase subunit type 1 TsaE [Leucothrix pacifica]|uniref:tRNA threonylcarbamoyladenosine biosynthesis protein TsaE n=2 Tax=Leucothrix pacifica TaxID=1247513 RepID=A0A317CRW0_9GAMM|nr:tRNA (adenosine(37)-N6)-threonylcarbamoyltransferase complex ATPase subunit type 1 TsaE [Leucothrix pacifica]